MIFICQNLIHDIPICPPFSPYYNMKLKMPQGEFGRERHGGPIGRERVEVRERGLDGWMA